MFQLLLQDISEEVEVVVEEEQGKLSSQDREKPEEQSQEHPRTGASSDQPLLEVLEALAALQVELSSPNKTPQPIFGSRGRTIRGESIP